jgi:LacI family transcriptional regulator
VPEDVSIVGFDDLPGSMYTTPPLTTVRQPVFDLGKSLGKALVAMINGEASSVEAPELSLIVRESARRIN